MRYRRRFIWAIGVVLGSMAALAFLYWQLFEITVRDADGLASQIHLGMSPSEVIAILGNPTIEDSFPPPGPPPRQVRRMFWDFGPGDRFVCRVFVLCEDDPATPELGPRVTYKQISQRNAFTFPWRLRCLGR